MEKEYISQILDKLSTFWPIAKGLKVLLKNDYLDEKTILGLIAIFEQAIKEVNYNHYKVQFQKSIDAVKYIQSKKESDYDSEYLDKLLAEI